MKLPIITETHFGARNDSPVFMEHFMRFFDRVFFPRIQSEGITTILHLGDFLDRRKFVNFLTLNAVRNGFVKQLEQSGATMHCILGNHDIRPIKKCLELAPELEPFIQFKQFFKFDGVELVEDVREPFKLGDVWFMHGHQMVLVQYQNLALFHLFQDRLILKF